MPVIRQHEFLLTQVFSNLISNGLQHNTSEVKIITIDYTRQENSHIFNIIDNGIGIPENARKKVFEIFQTVAPRDQTESTGIGLAIVKKIVFEMEGDIWIDKRDDNKPGSKITITLPVNNS